MVIVIMGVAGVGKTTVGRRLAERLDWPFHDADDLHPPDSVEQMRQGVPLSDRQRGPWLNMLAELIGKAVRERRPMVLACSALSRAHRAALLADVPHAGDVRLVHLHAGEEVLAQRLRQRTGHFFPQALLPSQIAAFEAPEPDTGVAVLSLDASQPVSDLVETICDAFEL
jgi:gluconokinase